jgi:hypothetical protein
MVFDGGWAQNGAQSLWGGRANMGLRRAFKGFFSGFRHGAEIGKQMREAKVAVKRALREKERSLAQAQRRDQRRLLLTAVVVIVVVILVGLPALQIVIAAYEALDDSGWISHSKVVSVRLRPLAWMPGEYKTCYSTVPQKGELTSLECDPSGDYHDLNVRFWGPIDRLQTTTWNCQREDSLLGNGTSLSCKVTPQPA